MLLNNFTLYQNIRYVFYAFFYTLEYYIDRNINCNAGYVEANMATTKQNRKCALAGNSSYIMKALTKIQRGLALIFTT